MKNYFFFMLIPFFFFGQSKNQELELTALRQSNNFSKPYRILKTTISDQSVFKEIYKDTDFTPDYVIRYHFYTSIDLNAKKNQLISMDGTTFDLSSKNAIDLTDEVITLVSRMYYGKNEFKEFKGLNK